VAGTLAVVDAGPVLTQVGTTVDVVVAPVLTAAQPVVEPVVEPVVHPVVEPVVTPLRPAVDRLVAPVAALPVAPPALPLAGSEGPARVHRAAPEGLVETTAGPGAAAVQRTSTGAASAPVAHAPTGPEAPSHGTPVSRSASTTSDGGTGSPVPYAVLLTAFLAVLLFSGGIVPRRVAAPLAPTFLPPVFPG
jgi:hypothetical protein